jgi:hypothetical protein
MNFQGLPSVPQVRWLWERTRPDAHPSPAVIISPLRPLTVLGPLPAGEVSECSPSNPEQLDLAADPW